jgi:hypothetical protein
VAQDQVAAKAVPVEEQGCGGIPFLDANQIGVDIIHDMVVGRGVAANTFRFSVAAQVEAENAQSGGGQEFGHMLISAAMFAETMNNENIGRRRTIRKPFRDKKLDAVAGLKIRFVVYQVVLFF